MNKQLITIFSIFSITCLGMVSAQESKSFLPEVKKESLTFSSEDNKFKLTFNGRIQADGAMFFGEDYQPIGNGVGFRRVRLGATAAFGKRLSGKIEMDLTDGGFSLKDCFIKYAFPNGLYFRAGNFKESFGMAAMTSSGDLWFMEKANVVSAFAPEYHIGVQGTWEHDQFLGVAGVHFKKIEGNKEKDYSESNNKAGEDEGISVTARAVWQPVSADKVKGLHLGIAASYRTPKTTVGSLMPNTVRYSTRSLSYINKIKFLDTSPIASVSHDWLAGAELAGFYRGFRFQGEYIMNNTVRMEGLATEKFNGFYVQAAYLLFGGQQRYSKSRGAFSQPSFGRSWGDIELAARFDRIDLNGTEVMGGSSNGWTFGVNYYATRNLKFQLNYSYVDNDKYANAFGQAAVGYKSNGEIAYKPEEVDELLGKGGNAYGILGLRIQLSF